MQVKLFLKISLPLLILNTFMPAGLANTFANGTDYSVCFTPGQDCENQILSAVAKAKQSILVQAYSFTSVPILKALVDAKNRGVAVKVILDKSQYNKNRYSSARFLSNYGIPVWVDAKPAIAHNKVMIIDGKTVVTGSFNFTKAAQYKNAENLLIISDPNLAKIYAQNWQLRQDASWSLADYHPTSKSSSRKRNIPNWF